MLDSTRLSSAAPRSTLAVFALTALALTLLVSGGPAMAADAPVPTLTASGDGEVRVAPDLAVVRLGVQAQAPEARDAQSRVNAAAQEIHKALTAQGVAEEDIQTSGLQLSPVYDNNRNRQPGDEPRIVAYQATNTVSVRLTDLDRVGSVFDAALEAGANRIDGVDFQLEDDAAARAEALTLAAEAARTKARVLSAALGVELGQILEIQEGGYSVAPPPTPVYARTMAMESSAGTQVAPGQITVSASVTVRWRIGG